MKLSQKESRELKRESQDKLFEVLSKEFSECQVERVKQGVAVVVREGVVVLFDGVVKQEFDMEDALQEYAESLQKEAEALAKKLAKEKEKESK